MIITVNSMTSYLITFLSITLYLIALHLITIDVITLYLIALSIGAIITVNRGTQSVYCFATNTSKISAVVGNRTRIKIKDNHLGGIASSRF